MRPVRLDNWIQAFSECLCSKRQPIILGTAICIIPFLATRLVAGFSYSGFSSGKVAELYLSRALDPSHPTCEHQLTAF